MSTRKPPRPILGPSAFLDQASGGHPSRGAAESRHPPGQAEASFFQKLVEGRHRVRLRLRDGSAMDGVLEWHDRGAIRVNLPEGGHRVVPKSALATIERLVDAG